MVREKRQLMSASEMDRTLVRLAHEILEKSADLNQLAFVGIKRRGVPSELLLFPGEGHELSRSVDALRHRWLQVTDVKRQIREHRTELAVGAAVVGALVGGMIALRRRR